MNTVARYTLIVLGGVLALVALAALAGWLYFRSTRPQYEGAKKLKGLKAEVEVMFDTYGIPHIYAQNEQDAYYALGYVHAQERLFQMEMIRRLANGRLSELFGKEFVKVDKLFLTLGLAQKSRQDANVFVNSAPEVIRNSAKAYLQGVNAFIENGPTPPEFQVLGIEKKPFSLENIFQAMGYMAYGFAGAYREDPLIEQIASQWGAEYLKDLAIHHVPGHQTIPVWKAGATAAAAAPGTAYRESLIAPGLYALNREIEVMTEKLPLPLFQGSNAWVIGPKKTANGKVIFENDAHIGYSQPGAWYEAHIEYPGYSFYGNHLAGVPFGIIGHTRSHSWGFTMSEHDDMDFFLEKLNPENPEQAMYNGKWESLSIREEVIPVKGGEPVRFQVKSTQHGPLVQEVFDQIPDSLNISMAWTYLNFPDLNLMAVYQLSRTRSIEEMQGLGGIISAPGLNLMYGDAQGNIGWWVVGKNTRYPAHVDTKRFLDGATGKDEPLGYYDFAQNPSSVNPPEGFVYSANNQPDTTFGVLFPGYYLPEARARRIYETLRDADGWTAEQVQKLASDVKVSTHPAVVASILEAVDRNKLDAGEQQAAEVLAAWDGDYGPGAAGPVIFEKLEYNILWLGLNDELGLDRKAFDSFASGYIARRSRRELFANDNSLWWDDRNTEEYRERRSDIFTEAFRKTVAELKAQLGANPKDWKWGDVHSTTYVHVLGNSPAFAPLYNVGPLPSPGWEESVNCIGGTADSSGLYKSTYGPSMRIVLDFTDVENAQSILPTGQSGHPLSPHYDDQAAMYMEGRFRPMLMNRNAIEAARKGVLRLLPE